MQFQRRQGLEADGLVGSLTWGALQQHVGGTATAAAQESTEITDAGLEPSTTPKLLVPARSGFSVRSPEHPQTSPEIDMTSFATEPGRASAAFGRDRATREVQGEALLHANGQWPPQEGHYYVVQIDQDAPPTPTPIPLGSTGGAQRDAQKRHADEQRRVATYLRRYTGETLIFKAVGGRLVEQNMNGAFRSAAHPGQLMSGAAPDVNRDGVSDVANLRSGVYEYHGRVNGSNRYDPVSNSTMKVARDLNHDGTIDSNESGHDDYGTSIQIHAGSAGGPVSIGCQTLQPDDFRELTRILRDAHQKIFTYLLVRRPNDQTGMNPF